MDGSEVVDAGLNGAEAVNNFLNNDSKIFQLAVIILIIGAVRMLYKYFMASKNADKELAKMDEELVKSLEERGFDANGNRIAGFKGDEQPLYERRGTFERSRVQSQRISSRHYSGGGTFEGRSSYYVDPESENEDGQNGESE